MGVKLSASDVALFREAVAGIMFPELAQPLRDELVSGADNELSEAIGRWGRLPNYTSLGAALQDFGLWFHSLRAVPTGEGNVTDNWNKVQVKVGGQFTDGTSLELNIVIDISQVESGRAAFIGDNVVMLERALTYTAARLNKRLTPAGMTSLPTGASDVNGRNTTEERVTSLELLKEFTKGKFTYKIKAGQWQQFGVPVYEEVLAAAGIDHEKLPMGITPFKHDVIVLIKDGKASKVKHIFMD